MQGTGDLDFDLYQVKKPSMKLAEPRIKPAFLFIESWWFIRDLSNGLFQSPYNWVVFHIWAHIYNIQPGPFFHCSAEFFWRKIANGVRKKCIFFHPLPQMLDVENICLRCGVEYALYSPVEMRTFQLAEFVYQRVKRVLNAEGFSTWTSMCFFFIVNFIIFFLLSLFFVLFFFTD